MLRRFVRVLLVDGHRVAVARREAEQTAPEPDYLEEAEHPVDLLRLGLVVDGEAGVKGE
jgi:hypothetical protein